MTNVVYLWNSVPLPPTVLPLALVCTIIGTVIIMIYLRWQGIITLTLNAAILFIGAYLGNVLTAHADISVDRFYVRPILASAIGMSAAGLVLLLMFQKNQNE